MRKGKSKIIDYIQQPEAGKRVTTLLKSGNLKKVSGKQQHALTIKRNRVITIILALILIFIGLLSVIFR